MVQIITETKNEKILRERVAAYNTKKGVRVGDYLLLPYGLYTRFTHLWDDSVQTGGYEGSGYYLGNGYLSYSGGLDSGVKLEDIEPTNETKEGNIWFFNNDHHTAHNGVTFAITHRVFKLKEGANTNGLPQIAAHEKRLMLDHAETITRLNGNNQPYTLPLPEVIIRTENINSVALSLIETNTGLTFKPTHGGYGAQPMKHSQLTTLLLTYNFECKYYNNSMYSNTLFLTFAINK